MKTDLSTQSTSDHHRVNGRLQLDFTYDDTSQRTRLTSCQQQTPLKVVRAFPLPDGGVLVHLHNLSGGVLGGDQLAIDAHLATQTRVQLTSTGATRIYRCRPQQAMAQQTMTLQVDAGGLLEYLPDPLIPFAGSRYRQETRITLGADAGLFWWDTLAPGRAASGEIFAYDELQIGLSITAQGKPLVIERFTLRPQQQRLASPLRFGPYTYLGNFYICRVGLQPQEWSSLERTLDELAQKLSISGEISWAVSTLAAHGLIVRALSRQGRAISTGLLHFWRTARLALYGQEAAPPRKIY